MGNGSGRRSSTPIYPAVDSTTFTVTEFDEKHGAYTVGEATKYDSEKPRMSLIDPEALIELAKVLTFGAEKYDAENWRKGMDWSRLISSLLRHINAFQRGEDTDPETGLSHMAHAMCNCMFLVWYSNYRKEYDDRYRHPEDPGNGYITDDSENTTLHGK